MGQLIIKREKSMVGMAIQLNCFVNNQLVCKIKNGEEAVCNVDDGMIEFKCKLTANPMSDAIKIDTRGRDSIRIIVKPGAWNPQVTVVDNKTIVTNESNTFSPTKTVGVYFGIDENSKQWAVAKGLIPSFKNTIVYSYDDIVDFELIEDGTSITKGGLGRAVIGGLLFEAPGAIVGGVTGPKKAHQKCTSLMIKITVNDMRAPTEYIKLITSTVDKKSYRYKTEFKNAQDIVSLLQVICNQREVENSYPKTKVTAYESSVADEIRKFKELCDEGIITEEEFLGKKKQLLGL